MIENFYNNEYLKNPITEAEYTVLLNDDNAIIPDVCLVRNSQGQIETKYKPDDLYYYRYFAIEFIDSGDARIFVNAPTIINTLQISFDYGLTWNQLSSNSYSFNVGDKVLLKNDGTHYLNYNNYKTNGQGFLLDMLNCNISGNMMSLFFGNMPDFWNGDITSLCTNDYRTGLNLNFLFYENYNIINAENLIIPFEPIEDSYTNMFAECDSMITGPQLRFKTLARNCLTDIFNWCGELTSFRIDTIVNFTNNFYWKNFQSTTLRPPYPDTCQVIINPRLDLNTFHDQQKSRYYYNDKIKLVYDTVNPWFIIRHHTGQDSDERLLSEGLSNLYNYILNNDYSNELLVYKLYMYTGNTIILDDKIYYIFEYKNDHFGYLPGETECKKYIASTILDFSKFENGSLVYRKNNHQFVYLDFTNLRSMYSNDNIDMVFLDTDNTIYEPQGHDIFENYYIYNSGNQLPLPLLIANILRVGWPSQKITFKMLYQDSHLYDDDNMIDNIIFNTYGNHYSIDMLHSDINNIYNNMIYNSTHSQNEFPISQYILIDIIYYNYKKYYLWESLNPIYSASTTIDVSTNPVYLLSETYIFDDRYIWINNDISFITFYDEAESYISLNCNMNYFPFIVLRNEHDEYIDEQSDRYNSSLVINNIKNNLIIDNELSEYSSSSETYYLNCARENESSIFSPAQYKNMYFYKALYLVSTIDQEIGSSFSSKKLGKDMFFNNQLMRRIGPKKRYMVLSGDFYFNYHVDDLVNDKWVNSKIYNYVGEIIYNNIKYYAWEKYKYNVQDNFWGYILTKYVDFSNEDELFNNYVLGEFMNTPQNVYILDYIYLTEDTSGYSQNLLNYPCVYYLCLYEPYDYIQICSPSDKHYFNMNKNMFAKDAYYNYKYNIEENNDNYEKTITYMLIGETIYDSKPVYIWKAIKKFNNLDIYDGGNDVGVIEDYALTYENEFTDKDKMIVFNHNSLYCPTIQYSPRRRLVAYWEELDEIPKLRIEILWEEAYNDDDYSYSKIYDLIDFFIYGNKVLYLWELNFKYSNDYIQGNDELGSYKYWLLTPRYNYEVGDIFNDTEYSNTYIMGIDNYTNGNNISGISEDNYHYKVISITTYE